MEDIPIKEIILLLLSALTTFLLWRVQHQKEKIKNVESQLSDKKYQMYSELIHIIFDIANSDKMGKKLSQKDLTKRLLNIKRDMFMYGSDEIFRKYTDWTLQLDTNPVGHMKTYFELMLMARKDMGQNNTKLNVDDFMLFFMQSKEEFQKFKDTHGW